MILWTLVSHTGVKTAMLRNLILFLLDVTFKGASRVFAEPSGNAQPFPCTFLHSLSFIFTPLHAIGLGHGKRVYGEHQSFRTTADLWRTSDNVAASAPDDTDW
jgi:hypothetical protein